MGRRSFFKKRCENLDIAVTFPIQKLDLGILEAPFWPGAVCFGYRGLLVTFPVVYFLLGKQALILCMLGLAVGQGLCCMVKVYVQRPRPPSPKNVKRTIPVRKPKVGNDPDSASFPSGDAMCGACFGGCMAIISGNMLYLLIGPWAAFGRVYWWCHWTLDVLAGMCVGFGSASITYHLAQDHLEWRTVGIWIVPFLCWMKALKWWQKRTHAASLRRSEKNSDFERVVN